MKKALIILSAIALTSLTGYSQIPSDTLFQCDTIYNHVHVMPRYGKGDADLMRYVRDELLPIIGNPTEGEAIFLSKVIIIFTIDSNGKVIDAIFRKADKTEYYNEELKAKCLAMTEWKAGILNSQPVCCLCHFPIYIHWQN